MLLDFKEGVSFTEFVPTDRDPSWLPTPTRSASSPTASTAWRCCASCAPSWAAAPTC
ncbi:hypothetical protein V2I01_01685 [Micromonospora sp. BRA006-A]|nr:hypothetical protein [Micromonospora sp. BRA006-A]